MSHISVSVIVTQNSRTIENTLLRVDTPLDPHDAVAHRVELEKWLKDIPDPAQPKVESVPVDQASQLAVQLPQILGARDPDLFSLYYLDPEGDLALVERRPYDWARLEAV